MLFSHIKWQIGILDISDLLNRMHITQKGVPRSYAGQDLFQGRECRDMAGKQCIRNPGFYLSIPTACGRLDI
jgi:hypothetical protein